MTFYEWTDRHWILTGLVIVMLCGGVTHVLIGAGKYLGKRR